MAGAATDGLLTPVIGVLFLSYPVVTSLLIRPREMIQGRSENTLSIRMIGLNPIDGVKKSRPAPGAFQFRFRNPKPAGQEGRGAWTPLNRLYYTRSASMVTIETEATEDN